jgi:hypothetical protein
LEYNFEEFIMEYKTINIEYILDDEEGLNSLFFEFDNGYFSVARLNEDKKVYFEINDQLNGEYYETDEINLSYNNGEIWFGGPYKDNELYKDIKILFDPIENEKYLEIKKVICKIFKI